MSDQRSLLDSYFLRSETRQEELRKTNPTDFSMRVVVKNAVPVRYPGTARMMITDLVTGTRAAQS